MMEENIRPEEKVKKIFSKNLTEQLCVHGKSQKDLVNFINVSSSTVSNWCTGQKLPRMDKIQAIAGWLDINTSDLIEEKKETPPEQFDIGREYQIIIKHLEEALTTTYFEGKPLNKESADILIDEMNLLIRRLKMAYRDENKETD